MNDALIFLIQSPLNMRKIRRYIQRSHAQVRLDSVEIVGFTHNSLCKKTQVSLQFARLIEMSQCIWR